MRFFVMILILAASCLGSYYAAQAQAPTSYVWKNVQILGGGFVSGIVYHPTEKDLIYARTDVGGAYRWDVPNKQWIPITDQIGRYNQNYTGILSLAVDPNDASRVYLATGLYTQSWAGTAAILSSTNKGDTWTQNNLTIKLGGNEGGRSAGERLQVDPNSGNILFLGSSTDGLWKSIDYGVAWNKVSTFPVTSSAIGSGGLSFVLFDKKSGTAGNPTPIIYVGILRTDGPTLYKSIDAGQTWTAVVNQPAMMPQHAALASNGMLYIAYSDYAGPSGITTGAVWKYNTTSGVWTSINPPTGQGGYGGISVDAQNSNTVIVGTLSRWWPGDEVFRSTDGGATWKPLIASATWDHSLAPYASGYKPHWIGDVDIDPFNSNNGWLITGYGTYQCKNLTDADNNNSVKWIFDDQGLEETVPVDLVSPPSGARLVSSLGDIDGFRHLSLNVSPPTGRLSPNYGTNNSIDFAEKQPNYMARTHGQLSGKFGAYSKDNGITWTPFATAPVTGSNKGGAIAVSADGMTLVWRPEGEAFYYSTNNGSSWTLSSGTSTSGLRPIADRENGNKFYAYNSTTGKVLISVDAGKTFSIGATGLPTLQSWEQWAASITTVFGKEGHLWLTANNSGLYRSTDGGLSFQKISIVQEAIKVGFGKAAEGQSYPAIYISAKINNAVGFYRSTDEGATWQRINDDKHQYGGVNFIAGDPRIFGRLYIATGGRGIIYGQPAGTIDNDCHGDDDGIAYYDDCKVCVGGNTGVKPCVASVVSGIEDFETKNFNYSPNPFKDKLHLETTSTMEFELTNMMGAALESGVCIKDCWIGERLISGLYILKIKNRDYKSSVKILKQ